MKLDSIGNRIRFARKRKGYSMVEIADKLGISKNTLYAYERDTFEKKGIPITNIEKLAIILDVSPGFLCGWTDEIKPSESDNKDMDQTIDVYSIIIPGKPVVWEGNIPVDKIPVPFDLEKSPANYYGLKVSSEEMYPRYLMDDTLIVENTDEFEDGDDVLVEVNRYNILFRKAFKLDNDAIMLRTINPEYPDKMLEKHAYKILGVVRKVYRSIK